MPKPSAAEWEARVRKELRLRLPQRTNIGPDKTGKARLQARVVLPEGPIKSVSVGLPYEWSEANEHDLILRIRVIGKFIAQGEPLRTAAALAAAASNTSGSPALAYDWRAIARAFEKHKREYGNGVGDLTWRKKYWPPINTAITALKGTNAPADATSLLEQVCGPYERGSRSRQIAAQNLAAFLRFAVERHGVSAKAWQPPARLSAVVGRLKPARDQYALTDSQILRLVEGLQAEQTPTSDAWAFAVQLCAVYGLRPGEIFYLRFRGSRLWCEYSKRSGGGDTKPRELSPAPVMDVDGPVQWNLEARLRAGEPLPKIDQQGQTGARMSCYLRYRPIWQQLCREAEAEGMTLVPYSLRHRFSAKSHLAGIPPKLIAEVMGHSLATHLNRYARFLSGRAADAYSAAFALPAQREQLTV